MSEKLQWRRGQNIGLWKGTVRQKAVVSSKMWNSVFQSRFLSSKLFPQGDIEYHQVNHICFGRNFISDKTIDFYLIWYLETSSFFSIFFQRVLLSFLMPLNKFLLVSFLLISFTETNSFFFTHCNCTVDDFSLKSKSVQIWYCIAFVDLLHY